MTRQQVRSLQIWAHSLAVLPLISLGITSENICIGDDILDVIDKQLDIANEQTLIELSNKGIYKRALKESKT